MPDNGARRTCSQSGPGRHRGERTRTAMPDNDARRTCSRSGPARHRGERTRTVMPENGSARACSRSGPARPSPYIAPRLASRPIAVLPIPSCSPPYTSAYRAAGTRLLSAYGGAWRSAMWGPGGVASDNRSDSNHFRLGASAEGRLAWPQASSPSGHVCKPPRPLGPHIALRHVPRAPIGRERRGAACVAPGPKPLRPPLQADPSVGSPRRAPPRPGATVANGQGLQCRTTARDARARDRGPLGWRVTSIYGWPPAQSLCRASRAVVLRRRLHTEPWGLRRCLHTGS
jgi:hypothetical protein